MKLQISLMAGAFLISGCATTSEPVVQTPIACETTAVYGEGVAGRIYPAQCAGNDALFKTYQIAREERDLRREYREIDRLIWNRRDPFRYMHMIPHRHGNNHDHEDGHRHSHHDHRRNDPFGWHRRWRNRDTIDYLELRQAAIGKQIKALRKEAGIT